MAWIVFGFVAVAVSIYFVLHRFEKFTAENRRKKQKNSNIVIKQNEKSAQDELFKEERH